MNYKRFYNVLFDDKGRRHWKPIEEERKVLEKTEEKKKGVSIDFSKSLEARSEELTSSIKIGSVKLEKDQKDMDKLIGFYCKLCDFSAKDNHSWLDHLNSFEHNRSLGSHMKVEKVTADSVSAHLSSLSKTKAKKPAPKIEDILKRLEEGAPSKKPKLTENH